MSTFVLPRRAAALTAGLLAAIALSGCNTFQRLSEVGTEPRLADVTNPDEETKYTPKSWPTPPPQPAQKDPASLWRAGARGFFKDIRAKQVGDIVTVQLRLANQAKLQNSTARARDDHEQSEINTLVGYEKSLNDLFPEDVSLGGAMLDFNTDHETLGDGDINRKEEVDLEVAATVTDVLPNGSLAIVGRQELRVNYELRELLVAGIIRPEDIEADNTISHERVAEMRLAYGGRGTLSDLQQPRWGTQVWDIIWPF